MAPWLSRTSRVRVSPSSKVLGAGYMDVTFRSTRQPDLFGGALRTRWVRASWRKPPPRAARRAPQPLSCPTSIHPESPVVRSLIALLSLSLAGAPVAGGPPANGTEVLQRMYDAYAGKWYKTLTFVQKTSYPDARVETWYEAAEIPGKLRIDVAPLDSMKTILFRSDSIYQYDQGKINAIARDDSPADGAGIRRVRTAGVGERRQAQVARLRPERRARGHVAGPEELGGRHDQARFALPGVLGGPGATGVRADDPERARARTPPASRTSGRSSSTSTRSWAAAGSRSRWPSTTTASGCRWRSTPT